MRFALTMAVCVLLFAGCGADEGTASGAPGDASMSVSDAGDCVGGGCSDTVCAEDPDCAPVYDEGCTCGWLCFPVGETPQPCPGMVACPDPEPNTTLACACDGGQCVGRLASP
jgi:hypothetical protein